MRCVSVVMFLCFKIFSASFLARFCLPKLQCLLIDCIIIIIISSSSSSSSSSSITVILISLALRAVVPITFKNACSKFLMYVIFNDRMFCRTRHMFNVANSQHISAATATIRPITSPTNSDMSLRVLVNHKLKSAGMYTTYNMVLKYPVHVVRVSS